MHFSGLFLVCTLIGSALAAPVYIDAEDGELVARILPGGRFMAAAHAAQAAIVHSEIQKKVNPRPNASVFWSGRAPDATGKMRSAMHPARKAAAEQGRESLEDHLDRKRIRIPDEKENPHSQKLWIAASKVYAERSKGEVNAYLGPKQSPHSVYKSLEKPILMSNPHVTKLTEHQLPHGAQTVVKGHKRR